MSLQIGDTVRVHSAIKRVRVKDQPNHRTATVERFMDQIEGGIILSRPLMGFRFWNVEELEKVS